jgi:hypothetical protein
VTTSEDAIAAIEAAFGNEKRPANDELLHPDCADDMDLEHIYPIPHWRDMADEDVIAGYASLSFFSAAGFRHFIPAYMLFVLRHPESPEAVVSSTIWAFDPTIYETNLRDFVASKFALLDGDQRTAIAAFLEAMSEHDPDAARARAYWESRL